MVIVEIIKSAGQKKEEVLKNGKNRINKKTPAVTSVEEWTRADTGVGAAIAAGSHLENGIWALLVIPATIIAKIIAELKGVSQKNNIFQCPWVKAQAILSKIITSPTRLAKIVSIPAAKDFWFW